MLRDAASTKGLFAVSGVTKKGKMKGKMMIMLLAGSFFSLPITGDGQPHQVRISHYQSSDTTRAKCMYYNTVDPTSPDCEGGEWQLRDSYNNWAVYYTRAGARIGRAFYGTHVITEQCIPTKIHH
jgi:hypothetical protein